VGRRSFSCGGDKYWQLIISSSESVVRSKEFEFVRLITDFRNSSPKCVFIKRAEIVSTYIYLVPVLLKKRRLIVESWKSQRNVKKNKM